MRKGEFIMNKKQLIAMWSGIILIAIPILWNIFFNGDINFLGEYKFVSMKLIYWIIVVVLVTGGLMCTFKTKDSKSKIDLSPGKTADGVNKKEIGKDG
jgi:uncharacterized membrane protein SpoIIM required for sporulation